MLNKSNGKDIKAKNRNIFSKCTANNIKISDHFFERWNERISRIQFEKKEDLESYIKINYNKKYVEKLWGDHYLIGKIMGGIYVTAKIEDKNILLITTLGTYIDNPVMYNVIISGKLNKVVKKYGKIDLAYAI